LTLTINELSAVSPLTNFTPAFVLNGFGIGMEQGALEISGAFVRQTTTVNGTDITEFRGGALIKSKTFGITAAGAFAFDDEMLSAFLYGILDKALGGPPFFYVTGLALGFGFNRDLLIPDINGVETFPLVQAATSTTPPASPDDVLKLFDQTRPDPPQTTGVLGRSRPQIYFLWHHQLFCLADSALWTGTGPGGAGQIDAGAAQKTWQRGRAVRPCRDRLQSQL
jgi:hypothetical protein